MARKTGSELVERRGGNAIEAYGRKLNNRARAVLDDALGRVLAGDAAAWAGASGRNFLDQLAMQLIDDPLGSLMRINAATPSDEDEKSNAPAAVNIQQAFLLAVQAVNKPAQVLGEIVEGTSRVQPELSDW